MRMSEGDWVGWRAAVWEREWRMEEGWIMVGEGAEVPLVLTLVEDVGGAVGSIVMLLGSREERESGTLSAQWIRPIRPQPIASQRVARWEERGEGECDGETRLPPL